MLLNKRSKQEVGKLGEELIQKKLIKQGFKILGTNVRLGALEIDILAKKLKTIVVCEVKTRTQTTWLHPAETITETKKKRIREAALRWIAKEPQKGCFIRFDVASVIISDPSNPKNITVDYYENAF